MNDGFKKYVGEQASNFRRNLLSFDQGLLVILVIRSFLFKGDDMKWIKTCEKVTRNLSTGNIKDNYMNLFKVRNKIRN